MVALTVLTLVLAGCTSPARTVTGAPAAAPHAAEAAIAGPVRDGDFEFAVLGVDQTDRVGDRADPALSVAARGVFVVVSLAIGNRGPRTRTLVDRDQTLLDDAGRAFAPSMAADIYGNPGIRSTAIPPGGRLEVRIAFDVPRGARPAAVVLRQSPDSPGATLALPR